jgi:hypothetical protein
LDLLSVMTKREVPRFIQSLSRAIAANRHLEHCNGKANRTGHRRPRV